MKTLCLLLSVLLLAPVAATNEPDAYSAVDQVGMSIWAVYGDYDTMTGFEYSLNMQTCIVIKQEVLQKDMTIVNETLYRASRSDVVALAELLKKHSFFDLPEEIEEPEGVEDGEYLYIWARAGEVAATCGGLNVHDSPNKDFSAIYGALKRICANAVPLDM